MKKISMGTKGCLVISCILMLYSIMGCNKHETEEQINSMKTKTFEARLISDISSNSDEWNNFHVFRYEVTSPLHSGIPNGVPLNIVVSKTNVSIKDFIRTAGNVTSFKVGAIHRLTITEEVPKGWESIRRDLEDLRMRLVPCLKADVVSGY